MPERILVVDDEPGMALGMARVLERGGFEVDTAHDGSQALSRIARRPYGLVVSDLRMPGLDGRELLNRVRTLSPSTQVVLVTAFATVESAVACVREGAMDYLLKPFSPEALEQAARQALDLRSDDSRSDEHDIVAEDPALVSALDLAGRAAGSNVTVLLEAESGAGKEVFARLIHRRSPRRDGPFVAVNCAALPRELLESELFGHARGAFTGAHRDRKGHFQAAHGGTLLLDEIGEMHHELQARLLRVLQDHKIQPVGSDSASRIDVRVIAATNRNLRADVAEGRFREDLYYRLRVMPIRVPPLREHPRDIEPLALRFACRFGGPQTRLTADAIAKLERHSWPGNIRELQNVLQRATILAGDQPIEGHHIEVESTEVDPGTSPHEEEPGQSLVDAERETIRRILEKKGGNRSAAAAALGISPRTLRHKMKRFRDAGRPVLEPK